MDTAFRVSEVVLDPAIKWGTVEVDGHNLICLQIIHPRHGPLDFVVTKSTLSSLMDWLMKSPTFMTK